jgi:hypothetical protein
MAGAGHLALAQPVEPPTAGALDNLGVLVLGDCPEHLQGKLIFWIVGVVLPLDDDLLPALKQLFDDDRLVPRRTRGLSRCRAPRLIGRACRCIAAHVERLPRLTLKAGRRAGCRAGSLATSRLRQCMSRDLENGTAHHVRTWRKQTNSC